jgi:hypothetical protein
MERLDVLLRRSFAAADTTFGAAIFSTSRTNGIAALT